MHDLEPVYVLYELGVICAGPKWLPALICRHHATASFSQSSFPITGKLTGNFLKRGAKSSNSAQNLQICFRNRELTGNFGKTSQTHMNIGLLHRSELKPERTAN